MKTCVTFPHPERVHGHYASILSRGTKERKFRWSYFSTVTLFCKTIVAVATVQHKNRARSPGYIACLSSEAAGPHPAGQISSLVNTWRQGEDLFPRSPFVDNSRFLPTIRPVSGQRVARYAP